MAGNCLRKAVVGETVKVCLQPAGRDRFDRIRWTPSSTLTPYQFTFPIIDISFGSPVIGVVNEDATNYGFSENIGKYDKKYRASYVLYPRDIKTTKIYKAPKKAL